MNSRAQAARALVPVILQKSSLDRPLNEALDSCPDKDRALISALCFGIMRQYFSLDAITQQLLDKTLRRKDTDIKALILVGLYQILYMRVPDHAAINETVSATRALKKPWASGLVNGALRRFLRDKDTLLTALPEPIRQEHPEWLRDALRNAWPNHWQEILSNNNSAGPLTLRVNQRKVSLFNYRVMLEEAGIEHSPSEHASHGVTLKDPLPVETLPRFAQGYCSVQDEAAQLCATLLDLHPGQRVLDACCAPGGKTCHIAETAPELSTLMAIDADDQRLTRVRENLERLQLSAEVLCANAQNLDPWWDGRAFDRILLDAPCSATGVIRRHPDIKLLRRPSDIPALVSLQSTILDTLWGTLAPGGVLLYATCSVLPSENEKQIAAFVAGHKDAIHLPIEASWGQERPFGRQLFPAQNGHDGFYYARLQKSR